MYALISREKIQLPPGTVVRMLCSWQDYKILAESRGDGSIPRMKYHDGEVLLMNPLPVHGRNANILGDIIKVLLDSQNRNYEAFTPITMELQEAGGIEPDYCFYIDNWGKVVGRDRLNWEVDPPPDLVLEIDVTSYTNAEDYLPYRVPEVWLFKKDKLTIHRLQSHQLRHQLQSHQLQSQKQDPAEQQSYQLQTMSHFFPEIDLHCLVQQCLESASEKGSGAAIRELRQRLTQ
ncbi:MAG: Uma2 family endonuclease [Microcoleaceae cyanobacterium]